MIEFLTPTAGTSRLIVGSKSGQAAASLTLYEIDDTGTVSTESRLTNAHYGDIESLITLQNNDWGDVVVTAAADGSVHRWAIDRADRRGIKLGSPVMSLATDAAGRWIAAGDESGGLWLWDGTSSEQTRSVRKLFSPSQVNSIAIDPLGRYLFAGCDDGVIRVHNLRLAKLLAITSPSDLDDSEVDEVIKPATNTFSKR